MPRKMIYIENNSLDPRYNLAFEEYVFSSLVKGRDEEGYTGIPVLLLWQNERAVIVGKYQNTIEEISYEYVSTHGVQVVRRNTGGGAVYHDTGNLNYSFIIPDVDRKIDFGTFTAPVVKALKSLGIPADLTGRNDLLVDGRKFSGNAQHFSKRKLLHHGTIMFDVNTDAVAKALKVKPGKFRSKATKSVRSRVTNLKPYFDASGDERAAGMTVNAFKELLLEWFGREYELTEQKLSAAQLDKVVKLKNTKYDAEDWNFGKSPKADVVRGGHFRCGYVEFHFSIEKHRVRDLKLIGDFFPSWDITEFEERFTGAEYTRQALLPILQEANLGAYLGEVTAEELIDVIV